MKEKSINQCECASCKKYSLFELSERDMHAFLGKAEPNYEGDRFDFEETFEYTNLAHWDVSECGYERYTFYRDDFGALLAWFDNLYEVGYRHDTYVLP